MVSLCGRISCLLNVFFPGRKFFPEVFDASRLKFSNVVESIITIIIITIIISIGEKVRKYLAFNSISIYYFYIHFVIITIVIIPAL